jgi:hypothetical protein
MNPVILAYLGQGVGSANSSVDELQDLVKKPTDGRPWALQN